MREREGARARARERNRERGGGGNAAVLQGVVHARMLALEVARMLALKVGTKVDSNVAARNRP
jgi:hypothetical protein